MRTERTILNSVAALGLVGALAVGWLMPSVPAVAQDALGAGDVLDANLDRRTGGRNLPIRQPDFRARNLTVTGDVAGGRGFRDDVGYRAAGDFAGELGSDDLFEFRARGAMSTPQAIRAGMHRDRFQLGLDIGLQEYRRTIGRGPDLMRHPTRTMRGDLPDAAQIMQDRMRPAVEEFPLDRWTAGAMAGRALDARIEPRPIGMTFDREGRPMLITASPIRGIEQIAARDQFAMEGLTLYDRMRVREDLLSERLRGPVAEPFERRFEILAPEGEFRVDPRQAVERDSTTAETDYARLLERIARRYADDPHTSVAIDAALLRQLDERFDDLRDELMRMRDRGVMTREEPEEAVDELEAPIEPERDPATERIDPRDELLQGVPRPEDIIRQQEREPDEHEHGLGDRDVRGELMERLDRIGFDEIANILRHGQEVRELSANEGTRFDELMRAGEQSLSRGDYFSAEQRFQRALRLTPGHPMASVGLSHAQLGAELDFAAARNLRRLLRAHPELIDVRYGTDLLPRREHLTNAVDRLRENLRAGRDTGNSGLLLAYLGHQLEQPNLIEQGLRAADEAQPEEPLLRVLRAVWLGDRNRDVQRGDRPPQK